MDVRTLSIARLAEQCQEETVRYLRRETADGGGCFELFRRAIAGHDALAWETIVAQYGRLVLAWVRQHPLRETLDAEDEDWVNEAFARFWKAVPADRFALFPNLAALLRYLKMCVHSCLADEARSREAQATLSLDEAHDLPATASVEDSATSAVTAPQLWQSIQAELQDEAERLVVYLSFALALKPAEIQARHPDHYPAVSDVYRIKRNVLERLRRSAEIQAFLG